MPTPKSAQKTVPAIKVKQWLTEWNDVKWDKKKKRPKPEDHFYIFKLRAGDLFALSDVHRRSATPGRSRADDPNTQRAHEQSRSDEIADYVQFGFPWSGLNKKLRNTEEYNDLKKPGWLPTAIIVNILKADDVRNGSSVATQDLIRIEEIQQDIGSIVLPTNFDASNWQPSQQRPIEIIDGQHRLLAFAADLKNADYELPVVAFHGLGQSWQAYLFWTINIRPKRINPSLAFDLYPLLRVEDWLDKFEGHPIYRETRAQELTELMWRYRESPWHQRINMLGQKGEGSVSQAAWIRALMSSYVKSSEGQGVTIGGLFGAPTGRNELTLSWTRTQQAAFLVFVWEAIRQAVIHCGHDWANRLREEEKDVIEPEFRGRYTLLNSDPGLRGVLNVTNDLFSILSEELKLDSIFRDADPEIEDEEGIRQAIVELQRDKSISDFVRIIGQKLAKYDWRSASFPKLSDSEKREKLAFRGSGGYKQMRKDLLAELATGEDLVSDAASKVIAALNY